jgi:hypothetical protein
MRVGPVSLIVVVLLSLGGTACADWILWEGSVSAEWNEAGNWVLQNGTAAGRVPTFSDQVGIGSFKDPSGYWPVIYDNPDGMGYSAYSELLSMSEWEATHSELTFEGGAHWQGNAYFWVGRHEGDTAVVNLNSGGISHSRWLMVGSNDGTVSAPVPGKGTFNMTGGFVYAESLSVGTVDGSGDAGSSLNISGGQIFVGGDNYPDASFLVGPTATMDIEPGGCVSLESSALRLDDQLGTAPGVTAKGELNIIADSLLGSGKLVIPDIVSSVSELRAYFGYDNGGTIVDGNINAIFNGGAGTFAFYHPGGLVTEITVVPEPGTLALLGFGAALVIRRKR